MRIARPFITIQADALTYSMTIGDCSQKKSAMTDLENGLIVSRTN
jgi:hypothetical protein